METNVRSNLKIVGDNSTAGGYYNNAKIVGNGIINGDLDCVNFKSVGDSRVNGNIKAEKLKIVGSVSVTGMTKSENAGITGNLDSGDDIQSNKIVLKGGITTGGSIKGNELRLWGYITIKKNCEAETLRADGQLTIEGLLNADEIDIKTYGQCRITEIGGDKITIRKSSNSSVAHMIKFLFAPSGLRNGTLVTDSIEGDEIRLAYTKAKAVRGTNVVIEDGCEIDLVEYRENLRIYGKSSIKEKRKMQ